MVENLPANAGEAGLTPGLGRSYGEGNGIPLQCPCLEKPRDGGAWCAAIYGVTQSRTRLKRLRSNSSSSSRGFFIYIRTEKSTCLGIVLSICQVVFMIKIFLTGKIIAFKSIRILGV